MSNETAAIEASSAGVEDRATQVAEELIEAYGLAGAIQLAARRRDPALAGAICVRLGRPA